jgi:hypothetical protein
MLRPPLLRRAGGPAVIVAVFLLAGCGSPDQTPYRGLASADRLKPGPDAEKPLQYRGEADLRAYHAVIVEPVTLYDGTDASSGADSQEDRQALADYMRQTFRNTLSRRLALAEQPGPGVLRLRLTLTGFETNVPVLSTVSHLMPVGLVVNTGLEGAGRNGTFFGSISYAAEISDSESGALLYAYVTRQTPDALDVTASLGSLAAARTGVRIGAAHLLADLTEEKR